MIRILLATTCLAAMASTGVADEFSDTLEGALEAYNDGDIKIAREDLQYAIQLLDEAKSNVLQKFLPEAMDGWTRSESNDNSSGAAMAMFGGGTSASATYLNENKDLTITIMADSPMVASISAMVSNFATMGGGGKPIRVQRVRFVNNDGELQGVVKDRILVSVTGDASLESKIAYLETMDLEGLGDF